MVHQSSGQIGFADALIGNNQKLNQRLDKVNQLVDWKPFEVKLNRIYSSNTGRPSYPLLMLFKSLLLQAWYSLSDYELEAALDDRFSFRRFVNLSAADHAPDHSTFSRFRDQLVRHGVQEQLFKELDRQLEGRGFVLKKGTLIDATVIEAAPKKPEQNPDGTAGKSPIDPEADWTKKGGRFLFGYKAHVGVDQHSELIRRIAMTPANVHDGKVFKAVLGGDEGWVFADKAYDNKENERILKCQNTNNGILMRGVRGRRLSYEQRVYNRIASKYRCAVERIFGTLKRSYRYSRARYLGLRKNFLQLTIMSMAYNIRRMERLCA